ncbi:hypothetical protein [Mesorhizobium sp. M0579]|uniref:hypothetical protein n=1 Tax=Mesorhizobium sp. M0579 TaxID=2956962 RepID=UPI00333D19C1
MAKAERLQAHRKIVIAHVFTAQFITTAVGYNRQRARLFLSQVNSDRGDAATWTPVDDENGRNHVGRLGFTRDMSRKGSVPSLLDRMHLLPSVSLFGDALQRGYPSSAAARTS